LSLTKEHKKGASRRTFLKGAGAVRVALLVLEVFVGLGAVAGGVGVATNAIGLPDDLLRGSPFGSYLIPGLVLLFVVGGSQLVAAAAVSRRHESGAPASALAGLLLVGWMVVQVAIIGLGHWIQAFYLVLGMLIVVLAARLRRRSGAGRERLRGTAHAGTGGKEGGS
jgi:peptidoglycan/LPS O-acetylase OafA/YrhL